MILSKYTYSRLVFLWVFIINASAQDTLFRYFTHNFHYDTLINNEPVNTIITAVEEVNDGYISFGISGPLNEDWLFAHKIDKLGQTLWTKIIDSTANKSLTTGRQVFKDNEGNIIVFYERSYNMNGTSNFSLVKMNSDGDVLWSQEYDEPYNQLPYVACESIDGNYLLLGAEQITQPSIQSPHIYIKKVNSEGQALWTKKNYYYNPVNSTHPISILPTSDGNYLIGGNIQDEFNSGDGYDHFLLKIDEQGDTLWTKQWGTEGNDGRIVVLSEAQNEILMTAAIEAVDLQWIRYYGYIDLDGNIVQESIVSWPFETPSTSELFIKNNYFITLGARLNINGNWELEYWQLSDNFTLLDYKELYFDPLSSFFLGDFLQVSDSGYLIAGYTVPENPPQEGWIIKIDSLGNHCSFLGCDSIVLDSTTYSNYLSAFESGRFKIHTAPNPCKDQFTLSYELPQGAENAWFRLNDSRGIERRSLRLSDAIGTKEVELSHCEPGIYFWRLIISQRIIESGKIVVSG